MAPNLVHVGGFVWEWTSAKYNSPHNTQGHFGFLGGHTFKGIGKLSNNWTNWHQSWYTSADSSGNGHKLNTILHSISQEHLGVLGGHKFKSMLMLSKAGPIGTKFGTCLRIRLGMDIAKYNSPFNTTGGISGGGGLGGHTFKSGRAAKRMDRLAPNSVHVCGFIWEWT